MTILPRHIAVIMDGNGRWAAARGLDRIKGHEAGVESVRRLVEACGEKQIEVLTLFAFSSENWKRPPEEIEHLFSLFFYALGEELPKLHQNQVQFRLIGNRTQFSKELQQRIADAETLTANNTGLKLIIAANYGGRWDITEACRHLALSVARGEIQASDINESLIQSHLSFADLPDPDLFIRTSGEQRISNFLNWQLSYTELYFTEQHWPDFDKASFEKALAFFNSRERRFGATVPKLEQTQPCLNTV